MAVHKEVIVYYTKQMKKAASQNVYSKHILMCFDCIFDNIYKGVTVNQIADELNISVKTVEAQITKSLKRIKNFLDSKYVYLF